MHVDERITIGISAYGNSMVTRQCLDFLFHAIQGDFELILVDDCSPDHGAILSLFSSVKNTHRNTKVFSFTQNMEYSGSLNCILSHAQGEKIFFISNDIYVTSDYIKALIDVANTDAQCGIVRGVSNFVDNELPSHNIKIPPDMNDAKSLWGFAKKHYD